MGDKLRTASQPEFMWKGINMHTILAKMKIHSTTEEDDLIESACVQNDHNLKVIRDALDQAYKEGWDKGYEAAY